jgi:hypothetical protein
LKIGANANIAVQSFQGLLWKAHHIFSAIVHAAFAAELVAASTVCHIMSFTQLGIFLYKLSNPSRLFHQAISNNDVI